MLIRSEDGSAIVDTGTSSIFWRPLDEERERWGLLAVDASSGLPIAIATGSIDRVKKAMTGVWEAIVKGKRHLEIVDVVGPPIDITIAKAMPEIEIPGRSR